MFTLHEKGRRLGRRMSGGALAALAMTALLAIGPLAADAATLTSAWRARIGSAGVNGSATIQGYSSGTGAIVLKLARLRPATLLPVTLHRGTCSSVGTTLIKFASIRTTSTGAAARTTSLTATQVNAIKAATKGTGKVAIRVGSSATGGVKCGLFAVQAVPPPPPAVAARITVGMYPTDAAITPTGVLVSNALDWTVSRVDPASNGVLSVVPLTLTGYNAVMAIASGEGALWATVATFDSNGNQSAGSVIRLDPASGQATATIPVGKFPIDIATSPGAVWVTNYLDGTVSRIDPLTNQVTATVTLGPAVAGLAYDFGSVWVAGEQANTVSRIDPATNQVIATIATVGDPEGITTGGGAVWVTNYGTLGQPDGLLSRIDPATNQVVRTIPLGTNPMWVSYASGFVWVAMAGETTVVQVNAGTNAVQSRIQVGGAPYGIAATDHAVWVTVPGVAPDATAPTPGTLVRINF